MFTTKDSPIRTTVILSAAAMAMTFSLPAYSAECQAELAALNERISNTDNNMRVSASGPRAADIRRLKDAARILDQNGREEECLAVVAAMEDILTNPGANNTGANNTRVEQPVNRDAWYKSEVDRIKSARPVGDMKTALRAKTLIGADVRNMKNDDLGEIEDFVLDPNNGKVQMIIMSHGGFLGVGDEQIAVPWQELSVAGKEDDRVFILNISEEAIENAPRYKRGEWSTIDTDAWRRTNQMYYKENRK